MIRPPGFGGAAFTDSAEGDLRPVSAARTAASRRLGLGDDWATVEQVHGAGVVRVDGPGGAGPADALVSTVPGLPLVVFTADCLPIVLRGRGTAASVHAGWRGLAAGVIEAARSALEGLGAPATEAAIGPSIGPCCYEVGPEVADRFPGFVAETTWGTVSVDLRAAAIAALAGVEVWASGACTRCGDGFFSHRRDATEARQAGIAWVP